MTTSNVEGEGLKILVTGRGGAASWTIRGEQIGAALGATVKPKASLEDMRAADVILVVKKVPDELLADLRKSGRPWARRCSHSTRGWGKP